MSHFPSAMAHLNNSYRKRECLRHFARIPFRSALERLDRPRFIEVKHGVKLVPQPRPEIVAHPLGVGSVDHTDCALELRVAQAFHRCITLTPGEEKLRDFSVMKYLFVAVGKRWADSLALGRSSPIRGSRDRAVVCREAD